MNFFTAWYKTYCEAMSTPYIYRTGYDTLIILTPLMLIFLVIFVLALWCVSSPKDRKG